MEIIQFVLKCLNIRTYSVKFVTFKHLYDLKKRLIINGILNFIVHVRISVIYVLARCITVQYTGIMVHTVLKTISSICRKVLALTYINELYYYEL